VGSVKIVRAALEGGAGSGYPAGRPNRQSAKVVLVRPQPDGRWAVVATRLAVYDRVAAGVARETTMTRKLVRIASFMFAIACSPLLVAKVAETPRASMEIA
jgi:hypothetical protein